MNELSFWDTPKLTPECTLKNGQASTRPQDVRYKWFRNTFFLDQKSSKREEGMNSKLMQTAMVNGTNQIVENYRGIIADLQQCPKIKNTFAEEQLLQKRKRYIVESNLDRVLRQNIIRNGIIQKQQQGYYQSYKMATQPSEKQKSIFSKSASPNIQASRLSSQNTNYSSKTLTMTFLSRVMEQKRPNINRSLYASQNGRISNIEASECKKPLNLRSMKRSTPPAVVDSESIFQSRKLKYCAPYCRIVESKKVDIQLEDQSIIKFIQSRIEHDNFVLMSNHRTAYKKRARTFYKG